MAKDPTRIPRPPNAFLLYRADFQKNVQASMDPYDSKGSNHCSQVSKDAGASWNLQPAQVKAKYYRLAEEAKRAHQRKYPDYKYAPARKGSNKKLPKKRSKSVRKVTAVTTASPSSSPLSFLSAVSASTASGSQSPSSSSRNTELETLGAPESSQNAPRRPNSHQYHSHTQPAMSHSMPGQSMLRRDHSTVATTYPSLQWPTSTSDIHPAMSPHPCALEFSETEAGTPSNRFNHGATPMRANSMADLSDAMFAPCAQPWQCDTALPDAPFTNAPREFDSSSSALSNTELDMSYHPVEYPTPTSHTATRRLGPFMTVPEALEYVNRATEFARLQLLTSNTMTAPSPSDLAASSLTDQGDMQSESESEDAQESEDAPWLTQGYDEVFRFPESEDSQAADTTL